MVIIRVDIGLFAYCKPHYEPLQLFVSVDNCGTSACTHCCTSRRQYHTRDHDVRNTKDIRTLLSRRLLYKRPRSCTRIPGKDFHLLCKKIHNIMNHAWFDQYNRLDARSGQNDRYELYICSIIFTHQTSGRGLFLCSLSFNSLQMFFYSRCINKRKYVIDSFEIE